MTSDSDADGDDTLGQSVIRSGLRTFDWVRAGNRVAVTGTRATLGGQAALARQGTELTRQVMHASLDATLQVTPTGEAYDEGVHEVIDEIVDAIDTATAESATALADDLTSAIETVETVTVVQQNLLSSVAATVFDVELVDESQEEPVRIVVEDVPADD